MYINYIYCVYESSDSAVSDQDSQFISAFWDEFCKILDVKLKLSTVNHSQTDEQTEIINQHMTQHLQLYVNYYQNN